MHQYEIEFENRTRRNAIFQQVYSGLRSQNFKQSLNSVGGCAYRGKDGHKCAVGWLIPDDKYTSTMEGCPINVLFDLMPNVTRDDAVLLAELMSAHDNARDPHDMISRLAVLTQKYKFLIPGMPS